MQYKWLLAVVAATVAVTWGWVAARDEGGHKDDAKAIRKVLDDYSAALNKGDRDKLLSFWAEDADFMDDDGKLTRGHDALAALFKQHLTALKGATIKFEITHLRFPRPDLALEDGYSVLTPAEGEPEKSRYNAVWIKTKGSWLINSVRELPPAAEASAETSNLKELGWLVGDWKPESKTAGLTLSCRWALNKRFLVADYTTKSPDGDLAVTQWIGWDPLPEQIHSWVFDSAGGIGEGAWTRDANTWTIESRGTLPDGRTGSGVNSIRFVDDNTFIWRSTDREVDGVPVADYEVKFARK